MLITITHPDSNVMRKSVPNTAGSTREAQAMNTASSPT